MKAARRLEIIPPYIFNEIDILKKQLNNPVDFGIGDPDLPTPDFIIDACTDAMHNPSNHRYPSYSGMIELRRAIADYIDKRFSVSLDPENEITVLIGSKEGIAHMMQGFVNHNDRVLMPSISYPVYRVQTELWGGVVDEFPIHFDREFVPQINDIRDRITAQTRLLFLNYPNNPTGATIDDAFFREIVSLAEAHDIGIINDGVYTDIHHNSPYKPPSILQFDSKKQYSVEFHSFSKTFNMTGWRLGYCIGNRDMIAALNKIKMNTDSGVFNAIQYAGIEALKHSDKHITELNERIKRRIERLSEALDEKGFIFHKPKASFYIFAKTFKGMKSMECTKYLMKECNIITAPGIGFGKSGDEYIRFSLTIPEEEMERGIENIRKLNI